MLDYRPITPTMPGHLWAGGSMAPQHSEVSRPRRDSTGAGRVASHQTQKRENSECLNARWAKQWGVG